MNFMQGDKVNYVGNTWNHELGNKLGVVIGRVQNQSNAIIVEFGDDAYILDECSLKRPHHISPEQDIVIPRKRYDDGD